MSTEDIGGEPVHSVEDLREAHRALAERVTAVERWRAAHERWVATTDEAAGDGYAGIGAHLDAEEEAGLRAALAEAERERDALRDAANAYLYVRDDAGGSERAARRRALEAALRGVQFAEAERAGAHAPGAANESEAAAGACEQCDPDHPDHEAHWAEITAANEAAREAARREDSRITRERDELRRALANAQRQLAEAERRAGRQLVEVHTAIRAYADAGAAVRGARDTEREAFRIARPLDERLGHAHAVNVAIRKRNEAERDLLALAPEDAP